jgi:hypothetical protein
VLTIAAQSAVGHDLRGVATSTTQFTRSIGGTVGVAIMGVIMSGKMSEGIVGIIVVLIGLLSAIFFGKTRLPMPEREGM